MAKFEENIKKVAEQFNAPYQPDDWNALNQHLNKTNRIKTFKKIGILSVIILLSTTIYYANFNNENSSLVVPPSPINKTAVTVTKKETNSNEKQIISKKTIKPKKDIKKQSDLTNVKSNNTTSATGKTTQNEQKEKPIKKEITTNTLPLTPITPIVLPKLTLKIITNKKEACTNEFIEFNAQLSINNNDLIYSWDFGDGTFSKKINPKHKYSTNGEFSTNLTVFTKNGLKLTSTTQTDAILINPKPLVDFDYITDLYNPFNPEIIFKANTNSTNAIKWDFGEGSQTNVSTIHNFYFKTENKNVKLTATNSFGCSNTIEKTIPIEYNIGAPSAFTPNGDGLNDNWMPEAFKEYPDLIFTLNIYNKKQQLVFSTTDSNQPWRGTNLPTIIGGQTYIWTAIVKDKKGEKHELAGTILVRH